MATKVGTLLKHNLNNEVTDSIFWTDSKAFPYDYSQSNKPQTSDKVISTALKKLNPICVLGVFGVKGKLCRAPLDFDIKHPITLPSKYHFTRLLIEQPHRDVGHCPSSPDWSILRQRYWVAKGAVTVHKTLGFVLQK